MALTTAPADAGSERRPSSAGRTVPASISTDLIDRLLSGVECAGDATQVTRVPFDGTELAEIPQCDAEDVVAARERALSAQRSWASLSVAERARVFLAMHDLVLDNQDQLMDLVQAENGKARSDAFLEVADIAVTCRYYARTASRALSPKVRTGIIPLVTSVRELRHPRGVVTVISPWNYPLSLAAGDTIPALLAGNAVVHKPDNQTALTALFARELAVRAGLPEDLWQIVLGRGSNIGTPLIDIADYVMFTGSTASGRRIAAQCGERLLDCSMELGGKNAMIVMADADLDRTVEGAVRACFSSSGQLCISVERMYVADEIWDRFVPRFVSAVEDMRMAPAFDFSAQMGSLTSTEQLDTVTAHVTDAIDKGATVLTGGRARPDVGLLFYEPTVLTGVSESMTCFANETFGPVVSLYRYHDLEEAIEWANDTDYGLNASVWASDTTRGREVAARMKAGTVNLNEAYAAAWGSIDAPMGGMGQSGLGRRHGVGGITKYTEVQTVAHQRLMNLAPLPGVLDDEGFAKVLTASLRLLKRIGWR